MNHPTDAASPVSERLAPPPPEILSGASLFLDFDGTLVEIADRPDGVVVTQRLRALMTMLGQRLEGRLAIVSGRSVAQIDALFDCPELAVSGSHGGEVRHADGHLTAPERPAALDAALAEMRAFAEGRPGVIVEDKSLGAALHYRGAPDAEAEARTLAERLADVEGLELQAGKMVFEVRLAGHDKGVAIAAMLGEAPFRGTRPVFVGDDITDEAGFAAVAAAGGVGILVGSQRETAALFRLSGVDTVLKWLEQFAGGGR